MEKEKKEKQKKVEVKTKSCKRKIVFTPPFSQNENGSYLIDSKEIGGVKNKTVERNKNKKLKKRQHS